MSAEHLELLGSACGCEAFESRVRSGGEYPLRATGVEVLQLNITRRCNLACRHCHVQAGPARTEEMSAATLKHCLAAAARCPSIGTLDITGGSPEMNPHLAAFLPRATALGRRLIVRSNLVILADPAYAGFLDLYAANKVEVVASLPDFKAQKTERQRGAGTFDKILAMIRELNNRGYGEPGSGLLLDLVYNPAGAYLPGSQAELERQYKAAAAAVGLKFNSLFCLTNIPVGRYLDYLNESGNFQDYMAELCSAYNPAAVKNVMCRTTISVGWDGRLYDCDFNQMLGLPIEDCCGTIDCFDPGGLAGRKVRLHNHCYGCTAGAGSSCQGSLEK
ncbi:MAG: arsenosugar biosynthesis radical SAM protein ArsS [Elusimicrobiales bacterium]|nr:arsenosugar biosynthesis radical SAM protein ArsS [Elusimicrobiales bacterium]